MWSLEEGTSHLAEIYEPRKGSILPIQVPLSPASCIFKPTGFKKNKNLLVSIWAPTEGETRKPSCATTLSRLEQASPHWAWKTRKETTRPYQRPEGSLTTKKPQIPILVKAHTHRI